jgi:hypothetical protein
MNINKKLLMIVVSFLFLTVISIALSFAYFNADIFGSESASVLNFSSGSLALEIIGGDDITAEDLIPNDDAWATKTFTVKGTNTTSIALSYSVSLVVDSNTFSTGAIKYSLTGTNTSNNGMIASSKDMVSIDDTTVIGTGYFDMGSDLIHTYTLSLYFPNTDEDQIGDLGKEFNCRIVLSYVSSSAPDEWNEAEKGTLLAGIKSNYSTATDTLTTPGQEVSLETEAVLASTEDDYGTSYYFRGAVENNYVVFANMCWRIVRITGDGSIKLTLYNYNSKNPCSTEGDSLAFYTESYFNENSYKRNSYVGFMYNQPNGDTYEEEHENVYDSTVLYNLKKWYNVVFNETQQSLLADTIWCNDKRVYQGTGIGTAETLYAAYGRLYKVSSASPSLKCGDTQDDNKISKFTSSDTVYGNGKLSLNIRGGISEFKIGLLTADEVAYAGAIYKTTNSSYYLYKNASSSYWWTLTPSKFERLLATDIVTVDKSGSLSFLIGDDSNELAVRPAISLVSSVKISSGDGTSDNPFVVDES